MPIRVPEGSGLLLLGFNGRLQVNDLLTVSQFHTESEVVSWSSHAEYRSPYETITMSGVVQGEFKTYDSDVSHPLWETVRNLLHVETR